MPAPDKPNGRPSPDKAAAQVSAQERRTTMDLGEVLELAEKPAEDEDPKPAKSKKPAQVLSPERRADLAESGITELGIERAMIRDHPGGRGWTMRWSDGVDSVDLLVYDRDKRPKDGRKNEWPQGQTTILNMIQEGDPGTMAIVVEGTRQHLAAGSLDLRDGTQARLAVYGMNGCDGIHKGIADRLPALFEGRRVIVVFDADLKTNPRVAGAAQRVARLLHQAGAKIVRVTSAGGSGKDGLDDVLGPMDEDQRYEHIAGLVEHATLVKSQEADDKHAHAIRDAVLDANDLDQLPDPEPPLEGYLNAAEAVWLAGKFGTYKSLVALAWSYSVATGLAWSGAEVAKVVPVVYVAAEGVSGLRKRKEALERHHGVTVPRGMLTIIRRPVHLERAEEVAVLREVIEEQGAKLVVLDTWHRMAGRAEENSNTEQGDPIDVALSLRDDFDATVLILDHTGHAQLHARGASAKEDDVDANWLIKLGKGDADDEDRSPTNPRTLVHRKAKDEELRGPEKLRLLVDDQGEATVDVDPVQPAPALVNPPSPAPAPRPAWRTHSRTAVSVRSKSRATCPIERSPRWHSSTISALNSGVNDRRARDCLGSMVSMTDILSGAVPLMGDVRQSGSGPVRMWSLGRPRTVD